MRLITLLPGAAAVMAASGHFVEHESAALHLAEAHQGLRGGAADSERSGASALEPVPEETQWRHHQRTLTTASADLFTKLSNSTIYAEARNVAWLVAADVNSDDINDVVSASWGDNTLAWYENAQHDGSVFYYHEIDTAAMGVRCVAAGDLDGDRNVDVVSANFADDTIAWYSNPSLSRVEEGGGAPWTKAVVSDQAVSVYTVALADLDGDGYLDIVAGWEDDCTVAWFANLQGDGSQWVYHLMASAGGNPPVGSRALMSVAVADYDGDHVDDVVVASELENQVYWLKRVDDDTWTQTMIHTQANGPNMVSPADVNGDGHMDALVSAFDDSSIYWYENSGDGSGWVAHVLSSDVAGAVSVFGADIDGDGDMDALVSSYWSGAEVGWFENTAGAGDNWAYHKISSSGGSACSAVAYDLNGNGMLDVIAGSADANTIDWFENDPSPANHYFDARSYHAIYEEAQAVQSVFLADVNNDGSPDVFTASHLDDTISWSQNPYPDSWQWIYKEIDTAATGTRTVVGGDIDGDGFVDAVAANNGDNEVAYYHNEGFGREWTKTVVGAAEDVYSVATADVDGDGDLDIVAGLESNCTVVWFENVAGDGSAWENHYITSANDHGGGNLVGSRALMTLDTADMDGDGDVDIAVGSELEDLVYWLENTGGGVFAMHVVDDSAQGVDSVRIDDVDGDGTLDVVVAAWDDSTIAWYQNPATVGAHWVYNVVFDPADGAASVYTCDIDGDGDVDVVSAGYHDDTIAWHENLDGSGTQWKVHQVDSGSDGASAVSCADINGDGAVDIVSGAHGASTVAWYMSMRLRFGGFHPGPPPPPPPPPAPSPTAPAPADDDDIVKAGGLGLAVAITVNVFTLMALVGVGYMYHTKTAKNGNDTNPDLHFQMSESVNPINGMGAAEEGADGGEAGGPASGDGGEAGQDKILL